MKTIQLSTGRVATVDDADYALVAGFKWWAAKRSKTFYAVSPCGNWRRLVYMHRVLTNAPTGVEVDHRDGNGLNNQRHNLRFAGKGGQAANSGLHRNNSSGFKGVSWYKRHRSWKAQITFRGRNRGLGYFDTAKEAALAYDNAALKCFGEFARTNAQLGLL